MKKLFSREENSVLSYTASFILHLLLFVIAYFFTDLHLNKLNPNAGYVQVFTTKGNVDPINFEKIISAEKQKAAEIEKPENPSKNESNKTPEPSISLNFLDQNSDTTFLQQIYSESTLNVTLKYPSGWTFIDQNVGKKLDGVTFWAANANFNPPPYVHLEVCDKSLFNQNRYKHNLILKDAVMYFNDPENLASYFSQTFYFRTESDEDFSLKLTIKGEEAFNSFTPTFYGMLKSFRFGETPF